MAKTIAYKLLSAEINHGTGQQPDIERIFLDKIIVCSDAQLEANEEIAKKEAYNGEYTVEDYEMPEPEIPSGNSVWDELDTAYQRGVDSV